MLTDLQYIVVDISQVPRSALVLRNYGGISGKRWKSVKKPQSPPLVVSSIYISKNCNKITIRFGHKFTTYQSDSILSRLHID